SPGLIEPQPVALAVQGVMNSPQKFLHGAAKTFAFCPGQMRQAVASMPSRRTALKRVKVTTRGAEQQVPAKRQNHGPATQRVMVLRSKSRDKGENHECC
ncbi:MAG: hypothetical protein WDX04_15085, partial [Klebsiella michiganensis]